MSRSLKPRDLHAQGGPPLALAAHGWHFVAIERKRTKDGLMPSGQMCVEYLIPAALRHPWPLVMVHGGGGQGLDLMQTADGRPGWAQYFVRQGYAVYVVDRPGLGRSPYHPDLLGPMTAPMSYEVVADFFTAPAKAGKWPQAHRHTQWPGSGTAGDPALDQFVASCGPSQASLELTHLAAQRAGQELLKQVGPAILLTHSAGGPCGWMIADACPSLVKVIVAVEPLGPPFAERPTGALTWGLTAAPLHYDPPVSSPDELTKVMRPAPSPDLLPCFVQGEPARKLANLRDIPVTVVTAEASWMARDNHGIVDFLVQAGVAATHLRLEEHGIHGNGHAMMLERNSDEIAALLHRWLTERGLNAGSV